MRCNVLEAAAISMTRTLMANALAGGFERLYRQAGNAATWDQSVNLLAGECVGGGTVVNYCTSFRTPMRYARSGRAREFPGFRRKEYTRSLDAVCARLSVNWNTIAFRARTDFAARPAITGWHCATMPRNVVGCEQGKNLRLLRIRLHHREPKQSAVKTWLADAQDQALRFFVETRAERARVESGSAVGVGHAHARPNASACAGKPLVIGVRAIHSPALLLALRPAQRAHRHHLHLHRSPTFRHLPGKRFALGSTMQAVYSDQFRF